jgi:toxin ParE1/3/4
LKIFWTDNALEQLWALHEYIAQSSPIYAKRIIDKITKRSKQIADFPLSGRKVPEMDLDQIREVIEGPYRIIYLIKDEQIDILAVIHGSQQSPWKN